MGLEGLRQGVCHASNQEPVLPVRLQSALSVAVFEFLIAPDMPLAVGNLNHPYTEYQVFCFHSVGTDILNSRSAHIARDQREILHAIVAFVQAESHHIIPRLTTAAGHSHTTEVILLEFVTFDT